MILVDLTFNEIYDFMKDEKIPLDNINFEFNGNGRFKANIELSEEQKNRFEQKLKELSRPEKRIDLLVKNKHGSYEKMDKFYNMKKGCFRAKYKRQFKSFNELLKLIDGKISINSNI